MYRKSGLLAGMLLAGSALMAHAQEPVVDDSGKAPKEEKRWAGSEVSLTQNVGLTTIVPGVDLSYNPYWGENLSVDPRWRLNDKVNLSAHLGLEVELTNSDVTSTERQPLLEDTWAQASYKLGKLPLLMNGSASLRLTLPTSKASIARETIFGLAPGVAFNRNFQVSKNVTLQPFLSLRASLWLQTARSLQYDAPTISHCVDLSNCNEVSQSAVSSSWMGLSETVGVNAELPAKFSASVAVSFVQSFLYDTANKTANGQMVEDTDPFVRKLNLYVLEGNWQPRDAWRLSGGFQTFNDQLNLNGHYEMPFFNRDRKSVV